MYQASKVGRKLQAPDLSKLPTDRTNEARKTRERLLSSFKGWRRRSDERAEAARNKVQKTKAGGFKRSPNSRAKDAKRVQRSRENDKKRRRLEPAELDSGASSAATNSTPSQQSVPRVKTSGTAAKPLGERQVSNDHNLCLFIDRRYPFYQSDDAYTILQATTMMMPMTLAISVLPLPLPLLLLQPLQTLGCDQLALWAQWEADLGARLGLRDDRVWFPRDCSFRAKRLATQFESCAIYSS
jgi:hypothetical protein